MIHSPTVGVGLKPEHYAEAVDDLREGLWFEVHPENYMAEGGPRLSWLEKVASSHPLSLHGVGMSLAADELPDVNHLRALKRLIDRFQPFVRIGASGLVETTGCLCARPAALFQEPFAPWIALLTPSTMRSQFWVSGF